MNSPGLDHQSWTRGGSQQDTKARINRAQARGPKQHNWSRSAMDTGTQASEKQRGVRGVWGKTARSPGPDYPGQGKAAGRRPPGLEHPGDSAPKPWTTGTSWAKQGDKRAAARTGAAGERRREGAQPRTGSTRVEQEGGDTSVRTNPRWDDTGKKAQSPGLEQPGRSKAVRRRPQGLERPAEEGEQPQGIRESKEEGSAGTATSRKGSQKLVDGKTVGTR